MIFRYFVPTTVRIGALEKLEESLGSGVTVLEIVDWVNNVPQEQNSAEATIVDATYNADDALIERMVDPPKNRVRNLNVQHCWEGDIVYPSKRRYLTVFHPVRDRSLLQKVYDSCKDDNTLDLKINYGWFPLSDSMIGTDCYMMVIETLRIENGFSILNVIRRGISPRVVYSVERRLLQD